MMTTRLWSGVILVLLVLLAKGSQGANAGKLRSSKEKIRPTTVVTVFDDLTVPKDQWGIRPSVPTDQWGIRPSAVGKVFDNVTVPNVTFPKVQWGNKLMKNEVGNTVMVENNVFDGLLNGNLLDGLKRLRSPAFGRLGRGRLFRGSNGNGLNLMKNIKWPLFSFDPLQQGILRRVDLPKIKLFKNRRNPAVVEKINQLFESVLEPKKQKNHQRALGVTDFLPDLGRRGIQLGGGDVPIEIDLLHPRNKAGGINIGRVGTILSKLPLSGMGVSFLPRIRGGSLFRNIFPRFRNIIPRYLPTSLLTPVGLRNELERLADQTRETLDQISKVMRRGDLALGERSSEMLANLIPNLSNESVLGVLPNLLAVPKGQELQTIIFKRNKARALGLANLKGRLGEILPKNFETRPLKGGLLTMRSRFAGLGGPLSGLGGPLSGLGGPLSGLGGPLSGLGGPLSGLGGPLSGLGGPLSGLGGPLSGLGGPLSGFPRLGGGFSRLGGPLKSLIVLNQLKRLGGVSERSIEGIARLASSFASMLTTEKSVSLMSDLLPKLTEFKNLPVDEELEKVPKRKLGVFGKMCGKKRDLMLNLKEFQSNMDCLFNTVLLARLLDRLEQLLTGRKRVLELLGVGNLKANNKKFTVGPGTRPPQLKGYPTRRADAAKRRHIFKPLKGIREEILMQ